MAEEITTEEFWNCECPIYFHHHKTISKCLNCNTMKEEQPDSILKEIINLIQMGEHTIYFNSKVKA